MIAPYQRSDLRRSVLQIINSVLPYIVLWSLMVWSLSISYWITLLLALPTAGFMVRTFIIFHDCGHGSFFQSQRTNTIVGRILGVLVLTPFDYWTRDHSIHHATAGDLDRRGVGDVDTLTVDEYLALSPWRKFIYRVLRNPFMMLLIGAPLVFLVVHRIHRRGVGKLERYSVLLTDVALAVIAVILILTIGWKALLLVELPVLMLGTAVGVWMFYVQHQFEGVYWRRHSEWNYLESALLGASYYRLPKFLQWFTGNIGYHHLHHLAPRIPNYYLEKCQKFNQAFDCVKPLTPRSSLKSLRLRMYDEASRQLIGYQELKQILRERASGVS
jgi:acyl-lipid omega-6 desaturase (Delta-12 desaturase)